MKVYIARHGETLENTEKRILGASPGVLTSEGIQQASTLAVKCQTLGMDLVLASDLRRVKDTCIFLDKDLIIGFTPWLRERNFGGWEGSLRKEVDWQGIWESPEEPRISAEVGAEPLEAFTRRIAQFMVSLFDAFGDTDKTVLLVSHIGVMNRCNFLLNPSAFTYIEYPNAEAISFDIEIIAKHGRTYI